jgi:hypothetical protein
MRGVYSVQSEVTGLNSARSLLVGTNHSAKVLELMDAWITNADVVTPEGMIGAISRITTLGTPTGTAIAAGSVAKLEPGSADTVVTWLANITAAEPTYSSVHARYEGFLNVAGFHWESRPENRIYIPPSASFGLRLLSTPTSFKAIFGITYRELG